MRKGTPPLTALRAFESASRHVSFARAAEELHVSSAAISHQIKQLEHWLGIQLFDRAARGITLTTAGRDYALRIRDVFDRLIATSAAVRERRSRPVVSIRAQFSLATMWLLPRVLAFNQAQSDIEVRVVAAPMEQSVSKGSIDLSIYHHRPDVSGYVQQPLLHGHFKVYAAPALLARAGAPTPQQLLSQPLLHTTLEDRGWLYPTWDMWFKEAGVDAPAVLPGLRFNLIHLTANACVHGAGFALLLDELCMDMVRAGSLVVLPGLTLPSPHSYYVFRKKNVSDEVHTVLEWLMKDAST